MSKATMEETPPPHVLLIDDDRSFRTLIGMRLKASGFDFTPCEDFRSAEKAIDTGIKFSGVLSDGFYPGDADFPAVGSMSLLRLMHHKGLLATTPVVIISTMEHLLLPHLVKLGAMPEMAGYGQPPIFGKEEPRQIIATLKRMIDAQHEAERPAANQPPMSGMTRRL